MTVTSTDPTASTSTVAIVVAAVTTAMTNTKTSKISRGNEEYLHSSVAFVEAIIKNQILKRHNFPIPGIMPALDLASIFSYYLKKI